MITPEKLNELLIESGLLLCNQRSKKKPAEILAKSINRHLKIIGYNK